MNERKKDKKKRRDQNNFKQISSSQPLSFDINMILLKSKIINPKFEETLNRYNNGITNYTITCPCCNSSNLITHGYYKRSVIFKLNNILSTKKITIKRVKCKECGHTHALIPMDIIPYKQVLLSIIITCIYDEQYFNSTFFSYDVRQKWIKQYKYFLPYIRTILNQVKDIYNKIKNNFNNFYNEFYLKTNKILFMIRKSNFNIGLL